MRTWLFMGVVIGIGLTTRTQTLRGHSDKEAETDRIARFIQQLGDDRFETRETASKALDAIGEPALAALRNAMSNDDAEVRRRALAIIQAIEERITNRELEKLQGTWLLICDERDGIRNRAQTHVLKFNENKWFMYVNRKLAQTGTIQRIEVEEHFNAIHVLITEGDGAGSTAVSIYVLDGESLKYVSGNPRPTGLKTSPGDGRVYLTFRNAKS
jgi:uncharacterized protein (TIGR03067 family)